MNEAEVEVSGDAHVNGDAGDAPSKHPGVHDGDPSVSVMPFGTIAPVAAEPEKKKRQARPYWLLVPVSGQTYEVHIVVGKRAVLKLLKKLEIDAADPRAAGIKLLRANQVALTLESQTIFKFGKADADEEKPEADEEDDEVI